MTETTNRRAPPDNKPARYDQVRQEQLLDQALEETFPASDPVAVMQVT